MAFESLSDKLAETFKKLRSKGRLTNADVKEAMREVRLALLEADVSYKVVKNFTKNVTETKSSWRSWARTIRRSTSPRSLPAL